MPDDLKVCVKTTLPIDAEMESRMVNYFWQQTTKQQQDLGYAGGPNSYIYGSWLWNRLSYMNRYENDFSDRLSNPPWLGGSLYQKSNRSLNFPKQFVMSHHASATGDLENYGWFAVAPEGGEDEHPALPLWERYLREKAKRMNLGMLLKNESARPALIRGEAICKVMQKRTLRLEPRQVRAVRNTTLPGDQPLRDEFNRIVTELDEWVEDALEPETKMMLKKSPKTWRLKTAPLELTQRSFQVDYPVIDEKGAAIEFIHPGDFIFDYTRASLDECVKVGAVVGSFYRMGVDDLFDQFDEGAITKEGKEYKEKFGKATANIGGMSAKEAPKTKQGEISSAADMIVDSGALPLRLYFEGYFRYDWNDNNRREYVYILIDWEQRIPISYDPTHAVLRSRKTHPYKMLPVAKKSFRAYGEGIYERFNDLSESADQNYNRIYIEQQTSGKIVGFDKGGFTQTWAGKPFELRGTTLWEKRQPDKSLKEIVDVVQVPAETGELRANMTFDIQTMASRGGGVSPAEAESAGLQGAQTATGLQILERQKNTLDGSMVDDLNDGHQDLVQTWAEEEALAFDLEFAQELFQNKTVVLPPAPDAAPAVAIDQASGQEVLLPPQPIEKPAAEVLADWIRGIKPDTMRSLIKLNLVKTKESEIAARADNRVKLITQYAGMEPEMQEALEGEFIQLLTLNGSQNAEKTLKDLQAATQQKMAQMQAQAAMQQPGGGQAPNTAMPPEGEPPVTGRPQSEEEMAAEEEGASESI